MTVEDYLKIGAAVLCVAWWVFLIVIYWKSNEY